MGVEKIGGGDFQAAVLESEQPVVIDFFATWCGPCRMVAPMLDALSGSYEGKVKFVKIDIDEAPEVAEKFAITGVPTLVVVKGGEEADRKVGALPKPALESWIQSFAG